MSRSWFIGAAVVSSLIACKSKAPPSEAAAPVAAPAATAGAAKVLPIPAEPPPPQAAKVAEVPGLEAALVADKAYQAVWKDHTNERMILLTALSDMVASGALHTDVEQAIGKAGLTETLQTLNKIMWRTGKYPTDFTTKLEAYLTANKADPRLGVWAIEEPGKPLFDATALAMWLHPNEAPYIRERLRAMMKGPLRPRTDAPIMRAWLAKPAEVIGRLVDLGSFTQRDCSDLGATWREQVLPNGQRQYGCEAATPPFKLTSESVIGTWVQVIENPSTPNKVASDTMRHVFDPEGTVAVRMDDEKLHTFKWVFDQGKHFVAYKYGDIEHRREFRLRSADEADVVESNGKVLGTYVREGSALAQKLEPSQSRPLR